MKHGIVGPIEKEQDELTDEEIVSMFLATYQHSKNTLRNYKYAIERFQKFIGKKRLNEVTWRDVELYKLSLLKRDENNNRQYATATISVLLAPLRSLYKWGNSVNINCFTHDPAACIKKPKVSNNSRRHFLTKHEVVMILQQLNTMGLRNYVIGLTLVLLGLRVSELVSMEWDDFHSDPMGTSIWLTVLNGKGRKEREVKVPEMLWNLLCSYRMEDRRSGKVFPITSRQVERIIEIARKKANFSKKVTPHWLRHTNATLALLNGASLQQVQQTLGHSHINTTQRYIHTVEQIKKAAPDFVEDCLKEVL
ncbi:tyrosine-type recombinase/integrase [Brevibacillus agri]|uniref:tyrosine-type recombinase/integrase n=1 Tax=Brevibacillus agri TaxID=51101 RepID=UPI000471AB72|nr:tyrosine-type recombinase/integrase [Brevibacillus agri]MED4571837.1 tyrosine-type recombinase/integrase [Brevibacillus agri]WHX32502.1 tyrosine-type recombinase/integrase [Brevibacillus agri]